MNLNQAITAEAKIGCLQISLQMEKKDQTFKDAMVEILIQKRAPEKVIRKFVRDKSNEKVPFQIILDAIKAREGKNWEQRKLNQRLESRNQSPLSSPG